MKICQKKHFCLSLSRYKQRIPSQLCLSNQVAANKVIGNVHQTLQLQQAKKPQDAKSSKSSDHFHVPCGWIVATCDATDFGCKKIKFCLDTGRPGLTSGDQQIITPEFWEFSGRKLPCLPCRTNQESGRG